MLETLTPTFICPRGTPGLAPLTFDMTEVIRVEQRIPEVAFVTKEKAPELLAAFNNVFLTLTRQITVIEVEKNKAVREAEKRRSIVILDEAPRILKEKGLVKDSNPAGSADLREAVLNADESYLTLMDKVDCITAVQELLKGKIKAIEMAYTSVKKILGESAFNYGGNQNLSAPKEIEGEVGVTGPWHNTRY